PLPYSSSFFLHCSADHRDLHSFPTRRSSDLRTGGSRRRRRKRRRMKHAVGAVDEFGAGTIRIVKIGSRSIGIINNGEKLYAVLKDRKSTRLNSSHVAISYAVFCLKKKNYSRY